MPTISAPLYFTVKDSDSKDYWGILADVLFEHQYVFYFNAAGELALFSLAGLTGTPAQMVSTSADVLAKNGDIGIKVTKRLLTWKHVDVKFKEAETLGGAVIYRDTTGQTAINDCDIPLAGGAYYPSTCDASTYAYIDYFLEDGREILSVGSAASDFVVDSGITAAFTNLGLSARVRFLNTLGITADIRKLKVSGTNVVAVKAQSKVIAGEFSKFKKEYEAKYLTDKTKATELANLLYYFYKNSSSTYKWRSYMGTLYPSETLFPAATLYPLGDLIALGEKIDLKDPVFSGLDVDVAVTKRKYRLGYYGADYEGVGIGTITLSSAVGYTPTAPAIVPGPKYLATKPLTADPLGASPDTADFVGQYGVYSGQRYTCTALPSTWALDDAGQTAAQVQAAVPVYAPQYLGAVKDGFPASAKERDVYLLYSETPNTVTPPTIDDPPDHRGVFKYTSSAWAWTQDPADILKAARDIVEICLLMDTATPPVALYGVEADYGITTSINIAHIKAAIIDILRVGQLSIYGTLKSRQMDTINPQTGETTTSPTPTYWPGSDLVTLCAGLADGWHAATGTLGGKNITHVVKGGTDNSVSYQSSDAEAYGDGVLKTIISGVGGRVTVFIDIKKPSGSTPAYININGLPVDTFTVDNATYSTHSVTIDVGIGDVLTVSTNNNIIGEYSYIYAKNFRLCPALNTIGVWNDTDPSALSIRTGDYYNVAGNVDVDTLTDFITADQDTYWKGSELFSTLATKVSRYRTIPLGGGTFNSKTCASVFMGETFLVLDYATGASDSINNNGYYNYSGSIVLDDVEGKTLFGDEDADGQYEVWVHNIPGSSDLIKTFRNTVSGAIHSITETRAPDRSSGDIGATHALHAVHNGVDFVRDLSLHNHSGDMHVLDVFSNFTNDVLGDWKQVAKQMISAWVESTAYTAGEIRTNDTDKVYICTLSGTSAASGGPTGTGLNITDGGAHWQYIGASASGVWEKLISQIYSKTGRAWYSGGRKPTGSLHAASYTQDQIFTALAPRIPSDGDEIILSGWGGGLVVSKAYRWDYTTIFIYGANATNASKLNIVQGSATAIGQVSISW